MGYGGGGCVLWGMRYGFVCFVHILSLGMKCLYCVDGLLMWMGFVHKYGLVDI